MAKWFTIQIIYSKMFPVSCANTHYDLETIEFDEMV